MKYQDVHVVDTFEEAEQFKYTSNNESVEVGTAVGYDMERIDPITGEFNIDLKCFEGIYFDDQN